MTTYTIIVQNNHGQDGNYAIFNSPPAVTANTSNPNVFTNTWLNQFIPDGGNTTVNTTTTFYACKFDIRVVKYVIYQLISRYRVWHCPVGPRPWCDGPDGQRKGCAGWHGWPSWM